MRLPLQGGHAVDGAVRAEEELDGWPHCSCRMCNVWRPEAAVCVGVCLLLESQV